MTRRLKSIRNKYFCYNCYDQNYLIECACGCGGVLNKYGKNFIKKLFIKGHNNKFRDMSTASKGMNHFRYKFGRYKYKNYWILTGMKNYPNANKKGRILEHVYNYQEYHKCCLLPWGVVHHIIPVSRDYCNNMPWNLMGMTRSQHMRLHTKKNMSGRFCKICKTSETTKRKSNGQPIWMGNRIHGFVCHRCYCVIYGKKKKLMNSSHV